MFVASAAGRGRCRIVRRAGLVLVRRLHLSAPQGPPRHRVVRECDQRIAFARRQEDAASGDQHRQERRFDTTFLVGAELVDSPCPPPRRDP